LHSCDDHMGCFLFRTVVPELVNILVSFHNDILNDHSHSNDMVEFVTFEDLHCCSFFDKTFV
jgi:hypothetical protein